MERPSDKRNRAQRAADRALMASLRLQGKTLNQIAAQFGLSLTTVKREMRLVVADWKATAVEDIATVKARDLARLDLLEAEAFAAWVKSKADYEKRIVEERPSSVAGVSSRYAKIETGGQSGDPRFLTVLLGIQERRSRIMGMDAPAKTAFTDPTGTEAMAPVAFPMPPNLEPDAWQAYAHATLEKLTKQ